MQDSDRPWQKAGKVGPEMTDTKTGKIIAEEKDRSSNVKEGKMKAESLSFQPFNEQLEIQTFNSTQSPAQPACQLGEDTLLKRLISILVNK
eukprot:1161740-Pelagomonas_calceolata.AAC.1